MKKYWTIFLSVFSNYSAYRIEILINLAQSFIVPLFMLLALSQAKSDFIPIVTLIPYYVLVAVTLPLFKSEIDQQMGNLAHSGEIGNFLVKPVNIYSYFLSLESSRKLATLIVTLPLLLVALIVFSYSVDVLLFSVTIMISFLVSYNLNYLFGLSTFWFDEFWVLRNLNDVSLVLLGGVAIPYVLFPPWAVKAIYFTPFPYIASLPTRLIQGQAGISDLLGGIIWILILFIVSRIIERRAIAKFSFVAN